MGRPAGKRSFYNCLRFSHIDNQHSNFFARREILIERAANKQAGRHSRHSQSLQSDALAADGNFPLAANRLQGYEQITFSPTNLEAF
jgi:hypothetical protein